MKSLILVISLIFILITFLIIPLKSLSAGSITEGMLEMIKSSGINLTSTEKRTPEEVIGGLIKVFLSVLGVMFIMLIIYGGWIWMRSYGNEEDIRRAKNILIAAFIGLAIILGAYAITSFIISGLTEGGVIQP